MKNIFKTFKISDYLQCIIYIIGFIIADTRIPGHTLTGKLSTDILLFIVVDIAIVIVINRIIYAITSHQKH